MKILFTLFCGITVLLSLSCSKVAAKKSSTTSTAAPSELVGSWYSGCLASSAGAGTKKVFSFAGSSLTITLTSFVDSKCATASSRTTYVTSVSGISNSATVTGAKNIDTALVSVKYVPLTDDDTKLVNQGNGSDLSGPFCAGLTNWIKNVEQDITGKSCGWPKTVDSAGNANLATYKIDGTKLYWSKELPDCNNGTKKRCTELDMINYLNKDSEPAATTTTTTPTPTATTADALEALMLTKENEVWIVKQSGEQYDKVYGFYFPAKGKVASALAIKLKGSNSADITLEGEGSYVIEGTSSAVPGAFNIKYTWNDEMGLTISSDEGAKFANDNELCGANDWTVNENGQSFSVSPDKCVDGAIQYGIIAADGSNIKISDMKKSVSARPTTFLGTFTKYPD